MVNNETFVFGKVANECAFPVTEAHAGNHAYTRNSVNSTSFFFSSVLLVFVFFLILFFM